MNRAEFIAHMEQIAPPHLAEEFDNGRIGLLLEGTDDIQKIACALDATPAVAKAAVDAHVDALVVHHPAFWNAMHGVSGRNAAIIRPLMKADINLYAMHTNFDHADGGINDALAKVLRLKDCVRMSATPSSLGVVGTLTTPISEISKILACGLRVWGDISNVSKIAVVGGSAFDWELIEEAVSLGAEAYLASELKYNIALESPIPCIEATHYALEAPGMQELAAREGWMFIDGTPLTYIIP